LTTLIQLEVATISEAIDTIIEKSIAASENVMEKIKGCAGTGNSKR
jgi:hypothetical protein